MSHGADFSRAIARAPHGVPMKTIIWCSSAIFAGIFGAHWVYAQWTDRGMVDFLQNTVFWMGVSQGGFMLSVAMTLTKARWGRPLKRISEAFAIMMPVL